MIFNGIEKDYLITLHGRRRSAWAPVSRNLITVPGMAGAYLSHTDIQARVITVPVLVKAKNISDLQKIKEDMAEWLIHDEPKELIFKDEPDRVYYALVDGELELDEIFSTGQGEITFICPDPYKYGDEVIVEFPSDIVTVTNEGTAEADPVFELEVLEPVTFAMIQNQDEDYMMIGRPVNVEEIAFEREELIMHNNMSSTVGWTEGDQVDIGDVSGTMVSDGSKFVVSDFGSQSELKWYGPALKTSLPEPLQNFRVDVLVENFNSINGVGRVEIYLLDINNNIIAKNSIGDAWETMKRNRTTAYVRSLTNEHYLIRQSELTGDTQFELWNDFDGMLRLQRDGDRWMSYIAKIRPDGTHHARETRWFTDGAREFQQPVAQIQVHIGRFGDFPVTQMGIDDLKVYKINDPSENQIPYIAHEGDVITFDHKNEDILLNGEPRKDLKNFGATFFKLKRGNNQLIVHPDSFNTRLKYRKRFK